MGVNIIHQDAEFTIYSPDTFEDFRSVCKYLISTEKIWTEWKTNYIYIYPIVSNKNSDSGYLYIPGNMTFKGYNLAEASLPECFNLDVFIQNFEVSGKFLSDLSYDIFVQGLNYVVRQEKLTLQKKTYLLIYAEGRTYIYAALATKMNAIMKKYLKENQEILGAVKDYIDKDILAEIEE